ncbi:MAG: ribosome silencing factor [Gammaproteobacteria bacterium]|nr:ribosome silencing factor [Gammaproteobacteria bacterium]
MQAEQLKLLVIDALEDIKAEDIKILDVTAMTDVTDFMIISTGKSTRQVKALANEVAMQAKAAGVQPLGVEGEDVGEWALVDLGDVIVHIMTPQIRTTYNLEKLWSVPDTAETSEQAVAAENE